MAKRALYIHLILALSAVFTAPVSAQSPACSTDYELIFELRNAEYGSYNVWDTVFGWQDRQERFRSALVTDTGNTLAAGERFTHDGAPVELVLTEIDRRGRVVWEKSHTVKDLVSVLKILPAKDGYMIVGNKETKDRRSVWAGFFKADGALVSQQNITGKGHLSAESVIPARDIAKGYLMAATASAKGPDRNVHGVLYTLNRSGGVVRSRAYEPGSENRILGIAPTGADQYLALGYMYGADGRKAGWLMKIDPDGSLNWQRQYPRGRGAELRVGADLLGKFIAVAGRAQPAGKGHDAGWLMVVSTNNGDIGWQRYFSGQHAYEARDMTTNREGLISLMLQGSFVKDLDEPGLPAENRALDFVRLLSVTPRGKIFISDEYFNAEGARAWQMVTGPVGERILVGDTNMVYHIEAEPVGPAPGENPVQAAGDRRSLDGWLSAATAPEPYNDPCIEPYSFLP